MPTLLPEASPGLLQIDKQNICLTLAAISGGILTAPVTLPVMLTTVATYLAVARGIIPAVNQSTMEDE